MNEWIDLIKWMNEMNEWMNEWMNERTNEWTIERLNAILSPSDNFAWKLSKKVAKVLIDLFWNRAQSMLNLPGWCPVHCYFQWLGPRSLIINLPFSLLKRFFSDAFFTIANAILWLWSSFKLIESLRVQKFFFVYHGPKGQTTGQTWTISVSVSVLGS